MLYIIGTPIGNLSDISKRAVEALSLVDVVFAEDTRTALNLLSALNIKKPCKSYYKDNEKQASKLLLECLLNGDNAALISEAGMPCISDPGTYIVQEVIKNNIPYEIIQGPTALIHGLIASGFSGSSFYFHGFLPHKKSEKEKEVEKLTSILSPVIFYESPHRVVETINILLKYFPTPIAITREATKVYEETVFIYNEEDIKNITIKGEFIIVVDNSKKEEINNKDKVSLDYSKIIKELLKDNVSSKDLLKMMKALGLKRNEAYELINNIQQNI